MLFQIESFEFSKFVKFIKFLEFITPSIPKASFKMKS